MIFIMEEEINNIINFLDITSSKGEHKISFVVYRKSTATDIIIPSDSCHPPEQKLTGIRYLVNRISTYTINEINKKNEYDTIKQILRNNKYVVKFLNRNNRINDTKTQKRGQNKNKMDQVYIRWKKKFITKLFKNSDLKISFKPDNTIGKLLTYNKNTNFNKYKKCGVHQLIYRNCIRKYIAQTDRLFHTIFQEHFRDFK